jgi:ABC-type multidrug transport system fused ATPase/permease subunit
MEADARQSARHDTYLRVLWVLLLCYAVAGKGFAYLGYPPIFIGELVLLAGLFVWVETRLTGLNAPAPAQLLVVAFMLWGAFRTVPGIRDHGVDALRGVTFHVQAGELVALIGPNGAGKTTCFNCINGQLRPDAGRVTLAGTDITGRSPRDIALAGVGRTFQVAATFASMTVRQNVDVALLSHAGRVQALHMLPASSQRSQTESLLERAFTGTS